MIPCIVVITFFTISVGGNRLVKRQCMKRLYA